MAVTRNDVLHIAELARLGVDDIRADALTKELSAILSHMEVLSQVDAANVPATPDSDTAGTPLRPDVGVAPLMATTIASIAPAIRDGFFLVPRLATHADASEDSIESGA
ncbi:MAG: Asp-tRNA(Asn)/Glu-tRNA(Gln) amidotransferase subunit GatC [Gemmatimonadaceae bacterium]